MTLRVAIATLLLATTTALPAFAATPRSLSLGADASALIETVQYRQPARPNHYRLDAHRHGDGYNAYASGASRSATIHGHDVIPGWPCVSGGRSRGGAMSAYPNWEICN